MNIIVIIKTFIRVNCLERLLESIKKYYNFIPIIICDNSINVVYNKKYIYEKFTELNIDYSIIKIV